MDDPAIRSAVGAHYARAGLTETIEAALAAAGMDGELLNPLELASLDQFHIGGVDATRALARLAALAPKMRVLDVGGGIGGPARLLAHEFGCRVEVLDLTAEFCRTGAMLTRRTRLSEHVSFRFASALDLPHEPGAFDIGWMQHSSMNLADKAHLYAEIHRVVRRGGRLALHEIATGTGGDVLFPVPWAGDPAISFLVAPDEMRRLIHGAGFREIAWMDETAAGLAWFERRLAATAAATSPSPLGLHLLIGPESRTMMQNLVRNLRENRIAVIQAVFERI